MRRYRILLVLLPLVLSLSPAACQEDQEGGPVTVLEEEPGLLAQAGIPADSAVALARAQVPGAHISKAEIEREDGLLIYSFDMTPAGEEGEEPEEAEEAEEGREESGMVMEVHVDASTGAILSVVEESGAEEDEGVEAGEEAAEGEEAEEGMEAATGQVTEESPGLFAKAAFPPDSALALARVRHPEARLLKGELEMEEGRLVFSLDLGIEGEKGITEVWIDALTGEIVSEEHEIGGEGGAGTV